ncbi:MAG TPA: hypothetical protein VHB70_03955 [Parafilimonas sp.]|nr:hypothetical protein [Parafilimonas sp.]
MKWEKKGLVFVPDGNDELMHSHASIPFATFKNANELRIYFSSRNTHGKSLPFFVDVDLKDPSKLKYVQRKPLMELGRLGTFDDSGIMPSCIVESDGSLYMYYIGWNPQITVSYRLSIGLAISRDGGETFLRYSIGPICDRNIDEPYFNTAPFVLKEEDTWRMWYISCTDWKIINNYPEPVYHIKYAESNDGINWRREGIVCIDYDDFAEALGRPTVFKEGDVYRMYFSYRRITDYRTNRSCSYRLGYAESKDGINWQKKNDEVDIYTSESPNDWDYQMIEYCHVLNCRDSQYMFYNGNGFGKSGFGYAKAE